jgi:spermidine synthase
MVRSAVSKDFLPPVSGSLAVLLAISGATGVAYEVLWARDFALLYGATAVGAAVVLAATFAGLAAGAWLGGKVVGRARGVPLVDDAAHPGGRFGLRFYAFLEIGLALAIVAYLLGRPAIEAVAVALARATFPEGVLRPLLQTSLAALVLVPPAALLGATLPAAAAALAASDASGAARLYAWNTLGGAAGALAAVALALPLLGVRGTYLVCAVLDVLVGGIALLVAARLAPSRPSSRATAPFAAAGASSAREARPRLGIAVAATTGFVGLASEVLWLRGMAGVLSNSVYSFAVVLASVLVGIVAGAALAGSLLRRPRPPASLEAVISLAAAFLAFAVLASGIALRWVPELSLAIARVVGVHSAATGIAVEALLSAAVIAPAAIALGTLFPLGLTLAEPRAPAWAVGPVLAANTAGAVLGSLAAAFVLLPRLGLGGALHTAAAVAAALALHAGRRTRALPAALAAAAACAAAALLAPRVELRWPGQGSERVLFEREGAAATVHVTADAAGRKRMRVNGQYTLGGTAGLLLERRQAHIPLLLHPAPRDVLAIGVGTADTLGAAVADPGVHADGVELLPEVLAAASLFATENRGAVGHPRVRLIAEDARSHLRASTRRYDVILSDLFLPWTAGTAHLYARELYAAGRAHLKAGGLFAQWLPLHQLAVEDLESIVATFLDVFPRVQLWVAYHRSDTPLAVLIGSETEVKVDAAARRARFAAADFASSLRSAGFVEPGDLAALYVGDERQLAAAVEGAPIITDDRPALEFSAPAAYFRQPALAGEALAWIAGSLDPGPAPIAAAPPAPRELRLALIEAQRALLAGDRPRELARYLDALAIAPEVRASRQALYGIARERLAAGDLPTARAIAAELARAAPESEEARRAAGLTQSARGVGDGRGHGLPPVSAVDSTDSTDVR